MIFAPPYYLNKVKGYSQLLLCEAPKADVLIFSRVHATLLSALSVRPSVKFYFVFCQFFCQFVLNNMSNSHQYLVIVMEGRILA